MLFVFIFGVTYIRWLALFGSVAFLVFHIFIAIGYFRKWLKCLFGLIITVQVMMKSLVPSKHLCPGSYIFSVSIALRPRPLQRVSFLSFPPLFFSPMGPFCFFENMSNSYQNFGEKRYQLLTFYVPHKSVWKILFTALTKTKRMYCDIAWPANPM